jgi:hypothetical protein
MATKAELLERAETLNIEGRSSMNKDQLEAAIATAESGTSTTTPEPAPAPAADPAPTPEATSPIATTADLNPQRLPESGPSDSSDGVQLVHEDGSRVTVPERMLPAMAAQGFHPAK